MFMRLKRNASTFKPGTYHFALVDYLIDELRSNNVRCKKRISHIAINLETSIDNVYDKVIVDCFNGNVYLRGKDVKDKKVLRLARFGGVRESDAMYCAKGSCKQIINYLQKLIQPKKLEIEAETKYNIIDLRRNYKLIDLRKQKIAIVDLRKQKIAIVDLRKKVHALNKALYHHDGVRDSAITYVNGFIYEDENHAKCIVTYLNEHEDENIDGEDAFKRKEMVDQMYQHDQLGFAHKEGNNIFIEPFSLQNVDILTVATSIKNQYPTCNIYEDAPYTDKNYKLLAKINCIKMERKMILDLRKLSNIIKFNRLSKRHLLKDLRKIADMSRDYALCIINGKIYSGDTHGEAVSKYLKELGIDDIEFNDREELNNVLGNNFYSQFAAAHVLDNKIYLDKHSLENINEQQCVSIIKKELPNYEILDYDSREKLALHDRANRTSAVMYLEGNILEGYDHWDMINEYLIKHYNIDRDKKEWEANNIFNDLPYMMGSKVDEDMTIYLDSITENNVDVNEVINTFKKSYPNYDIVIEEDDDESYNEYIKQYGDPEYIKERFGNKLDYRNASHDYDNRDKAIAIINGEVFVGNIHMKLVKDYLEEKTKNGEELNNSYYRLNLNEEQSLMGDKEDEKIIKEVIHSIAFAHISDNKIYLEEHSLYNITLEEATNILKANYPNVEIYNDDDYSMDAFENEYKRIAQHNKISKLKKQSEHDYDTRDSAIAIIDGKVYTAYTHMQAIQQALDEKTNYEYELNNTHNRIDLNSDDLTTKQNEDKNSINNNIQSIAFAHLLGNEIYLEQNSLHNITFNEAVNILKNNYPNHTIYNDDTEQKVARLKKNSFVDLRIKKKIM